MGWRTAFDRLARRHNAGGDTLWYEWCSLAFRAGYAAARRDAKAAEERSRASLSKAEAAIARQVALGGDAGETAACNALENAAALSRLLEAVGMIGPGEMVTRARKRRAG